MRTASSTGSHLLVLEIRLLFAVLIRRLATAACLQYTNAGPTNANSAHVTQAVRRVAKAAGGIRALEVLSAVTHVLCFALLGGLKVEVFLLFGCRSRSRRRSRSR